MNLLIYLWSVSFEYNKNSMKEGVLSVFILCCLPSAQNLIGTE